MRLPFRALVWFAIFSCLTLAVCTSLTRRSDVATSFGEREPLNTHEESNTPGDIKCAAVGGTWTGDSSAAARLRTIIRDSISSSARAAAVEAAFPDVVTYEALEARACALIRHGISQAMYAAFIDSVAPRVLAARSGVALAGSAPSLIGPVSGSRFDIYPRKTSVGWHSVPSTVHYVLEVQVLVPVRRRTQSGGFIEENVWLPHEDGLHSVVVHDTVATFFFVGAQPGRWRVRGVFSDGRTTPASEWRTFEYSR